MRKEIKREESCWQIWSDKLKFQSWSSKANTAMITHSFSCSFSILALKAASLWGEWMGKEGKWALTMHGMHSTHDTWHSWQAAIVVVVVVACVSLCPKSFVLLWTLLSIEHDHHHHHSHGWTLTLLACYFYYIMLQNSNNKGLL